MKSPFNKRITIIHTGHIGDIIAFIPTFRALQGTHLMIRDEPWMNPPMSGFRYDSVKPLLESQGIEVSFNSGATSIDYDMSGWRECYQDTLSLADAQARYVHVVDRRNGFLDLSNPWIDVEPDPLTKGRIIFNRSPRYRNYNFPWDKVLHHFGNKSLFIGTPQEHKDFIKEVGKIEYYETPSCLEVAKAIKGSEFFVGNQSSSCWIAMAMHHPLLQEVFTPAPNSIVEYEGAWYAFDDNINFDKLKK